MPTQAKTTFDSNIIRASYFLDIHEATQEGRGAPRQPRRELPRGAVVFAVSAMDAYLSEVSAEVLVARLQREAPDGNLRELLRTIQRDIPTLVFEIALLPSQRARLDRVRSAIVEHFYENVSAIGSKAVAATIQRIGQQPQVLWDRLSASGYRDAAARIDHWSNIRHNIVHRGESPRVRRNDARSLVELAEITVGSIDDMAEDSIRAA